MKRIATVLCAMTPLLAPAAAWARNKVTVFGVLDTCLDHSSTWRKSAYLPSAPRRHRRRRSLAQGDASPVSTRYDYNLSRRTMLYAGAARLRNEARVRFGINGNTGAALAVAPGEDPRSVNAGIRHSF